MARGRSNVALTVVVLLAAAGGVLYALGVFDPAPSSGKPQSDAGNATNTPPEGSGKTADQPKNPGSGDHPVAQPSGEAKEAWEKYRKCLAANDDEGARAALAVAWKGDFGAEERARMKKDMIAVNERLLYSVNETRDSTFYVVQQGDSLDAIAKKHSTKERAIGYYQIMHFNRLKTDQIQSGRRIRILLGTFRILVSKSAFTLTLMYNDTVVKEYPIAVGKDDATPEGKFTVANRLEKPDWDKRDDATGTITPVKYGDPQNVLGEIWMGFAEPHKSYGIHGTNDPSAIGQQVTKGCVRMQNPDVIELYHMTAHGTEVTITK